ncbi:hypothetical protein LOK49_LG02G01092, partial [Camellia lanceoleosa]
YVSNEWDVGLLVMQKTSVHERFQRRSIRSQELAYLSLSIHLIESCHACLHEDTGEDTTILDD